MCQRRRFIHDLAELSKLRLTEQYGEALLRRDEDGAARFGWERRKTFRAGSEPQEW